MLLSSIFVPWSKNGPAKVKDQGVVSFVKGGYGLYHNHQEKLFLLPLGVAVMENITSLLVDFLEDLGAHPIVTGAPEAGSWEVAARTLKTEKELPLFFLESYENKLFLSAFFSEGSSLSQFVPEFLAELKNLLASLEIPSAKLEDWKQENLEWRRRFALVFGDPSSASEDGFVCPECLWGGKSSSPLENPSTNLSEKPLPLEIAETPGANSIDELCRQLSLPPEKTLKTLVYATLTEKGPGSSFVAAVIRGDGKINPAKLAAYLQVPQVRFATNAELHSVLGMSGGYIGPRDLPEEILLVADHSAVNMSNAVIGANKENYHYKGACWGRDFSTSHRADLWQVEKGTSCPHCGVPLENQKWHEFLSWEILEGTSLNPSVDYRDSEHKKKVPQFFRATFFLEAILTYIFRHKEYLPLAITPFAAYLYMEDSLRKREDALSLVEEIHRKFVEAGIPVLVDDCSQKQKDSEFLAQALKFPWVLEVTEDSLTEGKIVVKGEQESSGISLVPEDLQEYFLSFFPEEVFE